MKGTRPAGWTPPSSSRSCAATRVRRCAAVRASPATAPARSCRATRPAAPGSTRTATTSATWTPSTATATTPDQHLEGNVHILRRLNPEGLGAYIYLDFGPWIWGYEESASTDQRLYDDSTPPSTPPTGPRGPGWDTFQYFIDNTATVSARGETLTASEGSSLDALICDPRHASCLTGYDGPAHVYDAHGLHRLNVLVGRTMGTELTGYASHIDFTLDDVYSWIEIWPTTLQGVRPAPGELPSWEPRADCTTSADANEHLGSTCNTTRYKTDWTPHARRHPTRRQELHLPARVLVLLPAG